MNNGIPSKEKFSRCHSIGVNEAVKDRRADGIVYLLFTKCQRKRKVENVEEKEENKGKTNTIPVSRRM